MSNESLRVGALALGVIGALVGGALYLANQIDYDSFAAGVFGDNVDTRMSGAGPAGSSPEGKKLRNREVLFHPDVLDDRRAIQLSRSIDFDTLLAPGEARPPAALQPLYVEARLPAMLAGRCKDWLDQFATRCMMTHAGLDGTFDGNDNQSSQVKITATYAIVPNNLAEFPGPATGKDMGGTEVTFLLPREPVDEDDYRSGRSGTFEAIRKGWFDACAELRARHGNCGLHVLHITENPVKNGGLYITALARLRWLTGAGGS